MKRKIIALLVVVLALVSTVGVGFAAWVVSKPVSVAKTGAINVDVVAEDGLVIVASWPQTAGANTDSTDDDKFADHLNLLGPSSQEIAGQWLTFSGDEYEIKSVTLSLKVTNSNSSKNFQGDLHVDLSDVETKLNVLKTANYITYTFKQGTADLTKVGGDGEHKDWYVVTTDASGEASFTIAFEWGSEFGNSNPYTYYNDGKRPDEVKNKTAPQAEQVTWAQYAATTLEALRAAVDGFDTTENNNTYTFSLTVYASASYGALVDAPAPSQQNNG